MGLDPVKATEAIREKYLDYLETTFALNEQSLHRQFVAELNRPGRFVKGPILEATPPFETGSTIRELILEGVLSPEFNRLEVNELPLERELYVHQEISIRKIVQGRRNIIVATGTGSGKTEAFLLPILNHLFRQKEQGKLDPGVRALLLYPMNALANDQLKRLRKLLKNCPAITFGSYTGETKERESQALQQFIKVNPGETRLPNELLSREKMQEAPPHILITNYAMLEYLLLRPEDNVFFDGKFAQHWRFLVIDEAHTYSGAKGIEMSMLIKRLKDRVVKNRPGALQCIGTSATLGVDEKDFDRVAQFTTAFLGEPFEWDKDDPNRQDIIMGKKKRLAIAESSWGSPEEEIYSQWKEMAQEEDGDIDAFVEKGQQYGIPRHVVRRAAEQCAGRLPRFLYLVLAGDGRIITLQKMLEENPCYLEEAAQKLFKADDGESKLVSLVWLANKARLDRNEQPLLPARYHLFIRALEGGYCSLQPEKQFFLERRERVEANGRTYAVFEIATCQQCSSLYLVGELDDNKRLKQPGNKFYDDPNKLEYFLILEDSEPVPDNEDEVVTGTADYPAGEKYRLCARCGASSPQSYVNLPCQCGVEHLVQALRVTSKESNVHKCPACGTIVPLALLCVGLFWVQKL